MSILNAGKQKPIPARYDQALDRWFFELPHGVPQSALDAIARSTFRINKDRWLAATGSKKEFIGRALKALEEGRYVGRLSGKGDRVLFESTEGTGKIFSFGGN